MQLYTSVLGAGKYLNRCSWVIYRVSYRVNTYFTYLENNEIRKPGTTCYFNFSIGRCISICDDHLSSLGVCSI